MPFHHTSIKGLQVFEPQVWGDDRGYFFESYNLQTFEQAGIPNAFVQDNQSKSSYGVLRGLHYQLPPFSQAKLVRVLEGEVLDVAVDIRPDSATYGQHFSILLTAENQKQLFIPRGFAHGFVVLSPTAVFAYKCDNFYNKEADAGIRFDDPQLGIDWTIDPADIILSDKDDKQPAFGQHKALVV
ncbi:MAG: dTDP-4-dehydrorhamnose 3,5-epimerase [Bacteroidota bacterium]